VIADFFSDWSQLVCDGGSWHGEMHAGRLCADPFFEHYGRGGCGVSAEHVAGSLRRLGVLGGTGVVLGDAAASCVMCVSTVWGRSHYGSWIFWAGSLGDARDM